MTLRTNTVTWWPHSGHRWPWAGLCRLQHLPHPAAFIAEIRRCLRPGGYLLIIAPARDGASITFPNLYWRLRAACYHLVPGLVRFYDTSSLPRLVEDQGLTAVECNGEPGRVSVLARA